MSNEKRELERDARRENEAFELGREDRQSKPAVVVPIRPDIRKVVRFAVSANDRSNQPGHKANNQ